MKSSPELSLEEVDPLLKEMEKANERLCAGNLFIEKYIALADEAKKTCCNDFN